MFDAKCVLPLIGGSQSKPSAVQRRIADKALENIIEPFPNYADIKFGPNFDWEHKEPGIETSFQLYLQNLRVVGTLLAEFSRSQNIAYLEKSEEIVLSWVEYVEAGNATEMTWYDHAVGARSRVLMQFLACMDEAGRDYDHARFRALLERHANLLMDDSLHRMNNHGLMMDMALISMGLGLERMDYVYHGLGRAESIFWQTFSETGMHQENSPEYHNMVSRMYRELEHFLMQNGMSFGSGVLRKLEFSSRHMNRLAKPDGKIPAIGDTGSQRAVKSFNWDSFHDSMSGFSILKSEECRAYLAFICGYSAKAHKHADDLSILLNFQGEDFFVDSGKYNYGKNKFRSYVVSYKAHSSFTPNRAYARPEDNRYSRVIATDHYLDSSEFKLASGHNRGFKGARLRRSVYMVPGHSAIVINDLGQSSNNEAWVHRFVLSPKVEVSDVGPGRATLKAGEAEVTLEWLGSEMPNPSIESGAIGKNSVKAVISQATNRVAKTKHLVFTSKRGKAVDASLVIHLGPGSSTRVDDCGTYFAVSSQNSHGTVQLPKFQI